ncbi:MAG: exodeoxyribonuclease V subunit beta [Rubrivivax sp.]|nr:exodeoxyribonuclease V subunit beta [Rubrivivax sp.]
MTADVQPLDPLTLPLAGSRLVEASAGTGKTWTIAALVLRLVLGHGDAGARPPRALMPAEILVMTFTRAATRELSDRIRRRLAEAAAVFRGEAEPAGDDGFLPQLLAACPAGAARTQAAWRLAAAAEAMDEAAVTTIDAWCQRMLREHAFDAGGGFDDEVLPDETTLRGEAVRDWWRQQVYALDDAALAQVLPVLGDVQTLARALKPLLEQAPQDDGRTLAECLAQVGARRAEALAGLKAGWVEQVEVLRAELQAHWDNKHCPLDKRAFAPAHVTRWLDALAAWAADPAAADLDLKVGWTRLTPQGFAAALKPGHQVATPAALSRLADLQPALQRLPDLRAALLQHAAAGIAARLQALKSSAGTWGFTDLQRRLADALDEARRGDAARRLRERIVAQFPAALVDEFQDTSPLQLAILDRLYRIADDDPATTLLLIGDPKQAIYGFRGADIGSYLRAREATAGRHHALATNHRSTPALVGAVNHLFATAEARDGEGAFGYAGERGNPLPFVEVGARGRRERLVLGGGDSGALTLCFDDEPLGGPAARERFAALAAEQVVVLLNDEAAGFVEPGKEVVPLRPRDIAVLVRTGTEAAAVRRALRRRGVASVYLSDRDNVFASAEAADLLRLLQAVAQPRELRRVRAALATSLLALSLDELCALADDEALLDRRCETMQQLHEVWRTLGVLAMLRRALREFELPARWLAQPAEGERRLTNVLHLAELLQAASEQAEGPAALLRWLAREIDDAAAGQGGGDELVLRLESDAELVQVVTVHKSKGLEYPVVLLPFAADFRAVTGRDRVVFVPADDGLRHAVVSPTPEDLAAAERERQREDRRLLYVAATRAQHRLWIGLATLVDRSRRPTWSHSAIGALVSGTQPVAGERIAADVQALAAGHEHIELAAPVLEGGRPALTRLQPRGAPLPLLPARPYAASFDRDWTITSYSALARGLGAAAVEAPAEADALALPRVLRDDEPAEAAEPASGDGSRVAGAAAQPWHRFPRGAFAGNFLHGLLEWLAAEGFALDGSPALQQALRRRCERQGWGHRADEVLDWLTRVVGTTLPPLGRPLSQLPATMPEMEFWLPLARLDAARIDALCSEHLLPGRPRPPLAPRMLQGLLMGFADLVFEIDGRAGVLDHKSNALGERDADYGTEAMAGAVLQHRYDVQAALYLLALQRLLKSRLGARYDAARHLHGATFLFLRGIAGPAAGCLHLMPPPALLDALEAMLAAPQGAPA